MSLKQFIFLRNDLDGFTTGALVAQACHASIAAIEKFKNDPNTRNYLESLNDMTTIVYSVDVLQIESICDNLMKLNVKYHLWMENKTLPTCIATIPVDIDENDEFKKYRKSFNLFK